MMPDYHFVADVLHSSSFKAVVITTRRRPKALTRDVWVSERITGMLDGNGS